MQKWLVSFSVIFISSYVHARDDDDTAHEDRVVVRSSVTATSEDRQLSVNSDLAARLFQHLQNQDARLDRLERNNQDLRADLDRVNAENGTFRNALMSIARKDRAAYEADEAASRHSLETDEEAARDGVRRIMKAAFDRLPPYCHARYRLISRQVNLPSVVDGYEDVYEKLLRLKLTYKNGGNHVVVSLPQLNHRLEGSFRLPACDRVGEFISLSMGPRTTNKVDGTSKLEVWVMPRFLLHKGRHYSKLYAAVLEQWPQEDDFAIFFNLSSWDKGVFYFSTFKDSLQETSLRTLYDKSKGFHIEAQDAWLPFFCRPGSLFLSTDRYPLTMDDIPTGYTTYESRPTTQYSMSIGGGRGIQFDGPRQTYTQVPVRVNYSESERRSILETRNRERAPYFFSGVFSLSF